MSSPFEIPVGDEQLPPRRAKKTHCRKAVDRAAKACLAAHDALRKMESTLPEDAINARHEDWIARLGEYADYLSRVTWPDEVRP